MAYGNLVKSHPLLESVTVSKTSLCLVSLIAAIPGAGLAGLMVISFLNYADKSPGALKALAGVSLLLGGALALMPVAILVFAGPKTPKSPRRLRASRKTLRVNRRPSPPPAIRLPSRKNRATVTRWPNRATKTISRLTPRWASMTMPKCTRAK